MPSFPPRKEPIKKKEQLLLREKELQFAIKTNATETKIVKLVNRYRLAQLSLFKAKLHEIQEAELQKKLSNLKIEKIETDILNWTAKTDLEIVMELKNTLK